MHPVAREGPARVAFRLGDLALVVREDVVLSAGVDVELGAQVLDRHRAALDVPARETVRPEAARPLHHVLRIALPQREVGRMTLLLAHLDARASLEILEAVAGQLPVGREARDLEVHVAVALVGVSFGDQVLDDRQHLRDVVRRARVDLGRADAELLDVGEEELRVLSRDLERVELLAPRPGLDLVLPLVRVVLDVSDVGDVHHLVDLVAQVFQPAPQDVCEQERPQIADVYAAPDGRAAVVHANDARLAGLERLLPPGEGVVDLEAHAQDGRERR